MSQLQTWPKLVLIIKEAFDRHEFSGRPGNFSGTFFQKGRTGISTTEGKHWKIQRDFLENYLNNLTGEINVYSLIQKLQGLQQKSMKIYQIIS